MEEIAAKLQKEANEVKETRASEVIPPKMTDRENTDDAIQNGEGELIEETSVMTREKTFARTERKKKNRASQKEKSGGDNADPS